MLQGYIRLVNNHSAFFLVFLPHKVVNHSHVFQQASQHHICMADDTHDLAIFYHWRTADAESLKQAGAVANVHIRMHGYHGLGHDFIDIYPLW